MKIGNIEFWLDMIESMSNDQITNGHDQMSVCADRAKELLDNANSDFQNSFALFMRNEKGHHLGDMMIQDILRKHLESAIQELNVLESEWDKRYIPLENQWNKEHYGE